MDSLRDPSSGDRVFDPAVYPEGCRCSACRHDFEAGELMVDHRIDRWFTTPVCEPCALDRRPVRGFGLLLLADGSIKEMAV
jgi:hypothetical protein